MVTSTILLINHTSTPLILTPKQEGLHPTEITRKYVEDRKLKKRDKSKQKIIDRLRKQTVIEQIISGPKKSARIKKILIL